jgi:hypothetical protein
MALAKVFSIWRVRPYGNEFIKTTPTLAEAKKYLDDNVGYGWFKIQGKNGKFLDYEGKKRQSNGIFSQSSESAAMELARDFHGRDNKGVKEYTLASYYPKDLADLGILIELQVFADDDNGEYIPINFAPEHPDLTDDETNVVLAAKDKQLYFIGGDQEYDIEEFAESAGFDWPTEALEKDEVVLGQVKAIAYFADKHHLEGPKEQKTGIPYQHEFAVNEETGEQIGEYPTLVYCQKDKVFKLVGGSYEILPEGISG